MLRVVVDFSGANARGGEEVVLSEEDKEHLDRSAGRPFWRCFLAKFLSRSSIGLRVLGEDENESAGAAGDETGAGTGAVLGVERTASGVGGTDSCSFGRCSRPVSPFLCSAGGALRVPVAVSVSLGAAWTPTPTPTAQRPAWRFWFSLVRRPFSRSLLGGGVGGGGSRSPVLLPRPVPPAREAGRSAAVVLDIAAGVAADDGTVAEAGRAGATAEVEVADFHAGEQSAKRSMGGPAEGRGRSLQVSRATSFVPARVNSRGPVLLSVLRSRWPRGRGGRGGRGRLVRAAAVVFVLIAVVVGGPGTHGLFDRVLFRGAPKLQLLRTGSASFSPEPEPGSGRGRR